MGWLEYTKKYVWNENTTPYFVKVERLSQFQARKELFVYTVFLGIAFTIFGVVFLSRSSQPGYAHGLPIALHAFSIVAAAVLLGMTKRPAAALYCVSAPVAMLLYLLAGILPAEASLSGRVGLILLCAAWLGYAWRAAVMVRRLPDMPPYPVPRDTPKP